jgi:NET1-associated nuclear protein 1 (U3 small nucleolar RNA-associated protein 17)
LLGSCGLKFFFVFHIYFSIQKFALMRMLSFPQMYISLVSLSIDGKFMCTIDVKLPEEELGGLVTLKFWNQGSRAGQYFLSTVIYEPHSDAGISAIAFRPGKNMAVSSSFGGNFKVWVQSMLSQPSDEKNQSGWRCQSVGSYKNKPMTAATFSSDGSVLAVAAENVVTLWDPDNNTLVGVIAEALSVLYYSSAWTFAILFRLIV